MVDAEDAEKSAIARSPIGDCLLGGSHLPLMQSTVRQVRQVDSSRIRSSSGDIVEATKLN
jgi:hypothetical protein